MVAANFTTSPALKRRANSLFTHGVHYSDFTLSVQRVKADVRQKAYKNINLCNSLSAELQRETYMLQRPVLLRGITVIAILYQSHDPARLLRVFTFIVICLSQVITNE
jgi:hypothetical protein